MPVSAACGGPEQVSQDTWTGLVLLAHGRCCSLWPSPFPCASLDERQTRQAATSPAKSSAVAPPAGGFLNKMDSTAGVCVGGG